MVAQGWRLRWAGRRSSLLSKNANRRRGRGTGDGCACGGGKSVCRGAHPLLLPLIVRGSNQRRRGCGRGEQLGLLCDPTRGSAREQHDAAARRGHELWAHAARRRPLSALHSPLATHYTRHSPTGPPHSLSPLTAPPTRLPTAITGQEQPEAARATTVASAPKWRWRPVHAQSGPRIEHCRDVCALREANLATRRCSIRRGKCW